MSSKKNKYIFLGTLIFLVILGLHANLIKLPITKSYLLPTIDWAPEAKSPYGFSARFRAKVIKKVGNEHPRHLLSGVEGIPQTQYEVELIQNYNTSKLPQKMIVNQIGLGYKNGILYSAQGSSLLQPGEVYDFHAGYRVLEKWFEFNPNDIKLIGESTRSIEPIYVADFSNDEVLVGASHNIFVGKIVGQAGSKERGIGPETQLQVEVIENIKGKLEGQVTVSQQGGYKDGILYVVGEGRDALKKDGENSFLLKEGSTYLLATRYNEKENWHTLNSFPSASKLITSKNISGKELRNIARSDPRVNQLKQAYPYEVLLEADIKSGKTLNSYKSLVESMKARHVAENQAVELIGVDVSIKASLESLQANSEIMGSSSTSKCDLASNSIKEITEISKGFSSCMSGGEFWAVAIQLKENPTMEVWCVDSSGQSKKETLDGTPSQKEIDALVTDGKIAKCD
ncbi:hypothetical protein K8Q98_00095 [Candidatus Nomurabacteria bacterium]|nr:hypothetical protein [Candidatus Nomurabacteria bacterium]